MESTFFFSRWSPLHLKEYILYTQFNIDKYGQPLTYSWKFKCFVYNKGELLTFPMGLFGVLKKIALVLLLNLLASSSGSNFQSALVIGPFGGLCYNI